MQVNAFELQEPIPELRRPHMIGMLKPWIDVGSVGTLSLNFLEEKFGAVELGRLKTPGRFYDFTRYRPTVVWRDNEREFILPTTVLRVAQRETGPDLIFLHSLEPHAMGEEFVASIGEVMDLLGVQRYCSIGSMYAPVPHTRPLIAGGGSNEPEIQTELEALGIRRSAYQGPTSIVSMVSQEARKRGIKNLSLILQLPTYSQLSEDYTGQYTMLNLLNNIYGLSLDLERVKRRGERLYSRLDEAIKSESQVRDMIRQLEVAYDSDQEVQMEKEDTPKLSIEMERFLKDLEQGSGEADSIR
jgi:predicted ATP-grasp superfamily ATP-dependent carboligase